MRFHNWISNIRWKYFTNSKSGLIFKELMKEFRMVRQMIENKRFEYWKDSDTAYDTKIKYGQYFRIIDKKDMVCLLNEQDAEIKRLNKELKRCREWINSDKNDYELTLAFIKSKGFSLQDVLNYEKMRNGDVE